MRIAAILALLTVVPSLTPAQDGDEAKKLFEAMEERLTKAKSVSLGFSIKVEDDGQQVAKVKGSMAFTEGDRVHVEVEGNLLGDVVKTTVTSTGTQLRITTMDEGKARNVATPKNLSTALTRMLTRSGIFYGSGVLDPGSGKREVAAAALGPVSGLMLSGKKKFEGREARVLIYKIRYSTVDKEMADVMCWVDPLTHLPVKQVVTVKTADGPFRITELYTNIKTDEKLDPKQFELPK